MQYDMFKIINNANILLMWRALTRSTPLWQTQHNLEFKTNVGRQTSDIGPVGRRRSHIVNRYREDGMSSSTRTH